MQKKVTQPTVQPTKLAHYQLDYVFIGTTAIATWLLLTPEILPNADFSNLPRLALTAIFWVLLSANIWSLWRLAWISFKVAKYNYVWIISNLVLIIVLLSKIQLVLAFFFMVTLQALGGNL